MSGITASLRFSGLLNSDLRKLGVNLVPFPRLHFFCIAQAPLYAQEDAKHVKLTVAEVTDQMWSGKNMLANIKPEDGKYLSASCGFRGNLASQEVDDEMAKVEQIIYFFFFHNPHNHKNYQTNKYNNHRCQNSATAKRSVCESIGSKNCKQARNFATGLSLSVAFCFVGTLCFCLGLI